VASTLTTRPPRATILKEKHWIEHYKNLWYDPGDENAPEEDHPGKIVDEISMEELESTIQGLKNRKASGLDGIKLELFKYGGILLKVETSSFVKSKLKILYHTQCMAESKDNISV
jgi:hypothetical protein